MGKPSDDNRRQDWKPGDVFSSMPLNRKEKRMQERAVKKQATFTTAVKNGKKA